MDEEDEDPDFELPEDDAFFADMASLCMRYAGGELKDPVKNAVVIQALAAHLGRFIARSCKGDSERISTMLDGAVQHAYEEASDFDALVTAFDSMAAAARKSS